MKKEKVILLLVITLAIIIRIYFFIITISQSLWWDESEYFNIARGFAYGIHLPSLGIVRPILLSLIISLFYHATSSLSLVENLSRIIIIIFSVATVIGFYLCGKEMYNKSIGLLASFFISIFSLMLVLTTKVMTDIPSFCLFTFGIYFFYLYLKNKQVKNIYLASITFAVGTLFRISILPMFILLLIIYTLKKDIKIKEALISGIIFIGIMIPYIIYGYIVYNSFVFTGAISYISPASSYYLSNFIFNMTNYIITFFKYIFVINISYQIASLILFILLFIIILSLKKNTYLTLIIVVPFITSSFLIGHMEDRYIIYSMLGIFLLLSLFIIYLYKTIERRNKIIAYIFIFILIIGIGSYQIYSGYLRTVNFVSTNDYIKEAGFLVRDNIPINESIVSSNPMQISYYSNRYIYLLPINKSKFDTMLKEKNIKYFVIFKNEKVADWIIQYNLIIINETKDFVIYKYNITKL